MNQKEAQTLLETLYSKNTSEEEKEQAYRRLSELFLLLLPKD